MRTSGHGNTIQIIGSMLGESTSHQCDSPHKGPVCRALIFVVVSLNHLLNKLLNCQWFERQWWPSDVIAVKSCQCMCKEFQKNTDKQGETRAKVNLVHFSASKSALTHWGLKHGSLETHFERHFLEIYICIMTLREFFLLKFVRSSLWHSDAIRRQWSRSTLAQVMACYLTAPSHYLNQCWLVIGKVLWHSSVGNFVRHTSATIH